LYFLWQDLSPSFSCFGSWIVLHQGAWWW
jgi:hypothetical protein